MAKRLSRVAMTMFKVETECEESETDEVKAVTHW
jgi:hypothetical protein